MAAAGLAPGTVDAHLDVTPNKEMRLLRNHTRSAVLVHRRGRQASLANLSWEDISDKLEQIASKKPLAL
ncbi:hypothetical protein [Simplicispira psychrophila]|uniref:hypothetical protein n=1 Tax=Simplicispira psychrophila TaxID=80882 RepID=UPI000A55F8F9|nr:hypothetical protein [Simplicispira psychrophila]